MQVDGAVAGPVSIGDSGTLAGWGTVSGSGISMIGAATIAPGPVGGPGVLTYANASNLTLGSSSIFAVDLDGTTAGSGYDRLNITNSSTVLDLNGATLDVNLGYLPSLSSSFQIIAQTHPSPITSRFNGLSQFASFTEGPVTFSIGYFNSGVTLTVTSINVPTCTWSGDGGDNNWSDGANWVGGDAPTDGASLLFPDGAARLASNDDLGAGFQSIRLSSTAPGTRSPATPSPWRTVSRAPTVAGTSTFALDTTLTQAETFDVATGGTLDRTGVITVSNFGGGYGVTTSLPSTTAPTR